MGKIDYLAINLQKPNAIYYAGEHIGGTVNLRVKEQLKINCIKLAVKGFARVHWTETTSTGKTRHTRHYSATEVYLNFDVILLTKQPSVDLYLEPGDYVYPFSVNLPVNLPTSFEHTFGRIRYSLYATIDIPWSLNKHSTRSFSVINNFDLNHYPMLQQPNSMVGAKTFCCGICRSEPIIAKLVIKKCGFVPGERIEFSVSIDNQSNRLANSLSVMVVQQARFHATTKSKACTRAVITVRLPRDVKPKSRDEFNNLSLVIPAVCSSSNGYSRIIEINYTFVLSFGAQGFSVNGNLVIPIKIGTIPLIDPAGSFARGGNSQSAGVYAPRDASQPSGGPGMNAPPPSYEACIFGSEMQPESDMTTGGEVYSNDSDTYRPYYPFYKNYSSS